MAAFEARAAIPAADWPQEPIAVLNDFWTSVMKKDTDRLLLFCPGSLAGDFAPFVQLGVENLRSIELPEPHPDNPDIMLYPVKVDFPGMPNKTIKMAVTKMRDGKLGIDGQYTIWW